jgi:hypothetical protein
MGAGSVGLRRWAARRRDLAFQAPDLGQALYGLIALLLFVALSVATLAYDDRDRWLGVGVVMSAVGAGFWLSPRAVASAVLLVWAAPLLAGAEAGEGIGLAHSAFLQLGGLLFLALGTSVVYRALLGRRRTASGGSKPVASIGPPRPREGAGEGHARPVRSPETKARWPYPAKLNDNDAAALRRRLSGLSLELAETAFVVRRRRFNASL